MNAVTRSSSYSGRLVLLASTSLLGFSLANAQVPSPVYQADFVDAVTGNNQFYNSGEDKRYWYVNQSVGADGSTGSIEPDSYQNDQYERPTDQTYLYKTVNTIPPGGAYLSGLNADTEQGVGSTAFGAVFQRIVTELLQCIQLMATRLASVFVNRHISALAVC